MPDPVVDLQRARMVEANSGRILLAVARRYVQVERDGTPSEREQLLSRLAQEVQLHQRTVDRTRAAEEAAGP